LIQVFGGRRKLFFRKSLIEKSREIAKRMHSPK
jgi:hypothetical protein